MPSTVSSKPSTVSSKSTDSSQPELFSAVYPRFYRTSTITNRAPHRVIEQLGLFDTEERESLNEVRRGVLSTLSFCRTVIASLEVTRLRKSRVGLANWAYFWERAYVRDVHERESGRQLTRRVARAHGQIDRLFRNVAQILQFQTQGCENFVASSESGNDILRAAVTLELIVHRYCRRRRKRARDILDRMRASIQRIPLIVTDNIFIDLKRGVFGLTERCEYHPGDPEAEEQEQTYLLVVWPYGYRRYALSPRYFRMYQDNFMRLFPHVYGRPETSQQLGGSTNADEDLINCPSTSTQGNDGGLLHGHPVNVERS